MSFVPRTFEEILVDMIAYVQARTTLTDFTVGSVIRTILEASAFEDDEQYFQMVQLLDDFRLTTATGESLDRRLGDFGLTREPAKRAFGRVQFFDSNVTSDQVSVDTLVGATSVVVFSSSKFPTTGFPYTIRIGEGTVRAQDCIVVANDTISGTFTLNSATPLITDIFVSDRVTLVTGSVSRTINTSTAIQAAATVSERSKTYATKEPAFILAGNLFSNKVLILAVDAGETGNTGINRVSKFSGSPPFSGARVFNTTAIEGGANRETDQEFRSRALAQLQGLSRGTPQAMKSSSVGIQDPRTGQRVQSSNIVEAFDANEVIVYIDDGTGLDPDVAPLPSDSLSAGVTAAVDTTLPLNSGVDFPSSGFVLIEAEGSNVSELVEVVAHPSTDVLRLSTTVVGSHGSGAIVSFVDVLSSGAETGQRRFRTQNFPVVRNTERIFVKPTVSSWTLLLRDIDYRINRGTGEFILLDAAGLSSGTKVAAHYTYYTNLVAETQRVLEGDPNDSSSFPGVKAAGIFLVVEAPVIKRVTVRATLTAEDRFTEPDLVGPVRRAIEDYINGLGIGEDVIVSKMVDVAHDIDGVRDISISLPARNVVVLENELPVPFDTDGDSLVTVL